MTRKTFSKNCYTLRDYGRKQKSYLGEPQEEEQ